MITPTPLLVAILGSATVLAIALGILVPAYLRRRELEKRIGSVVASDRVATDLGGRRRSRGVAGARQRSMNRIARALHSALEEAALDATPTELLVAAGIIAFAAGALALVLGAGWLVALVIAAAGGALPFLWLRVRRSRRQGAFRSQLADNVSLLAATVRAGHSLLQALEEVAREAPEPSAGAFSQVVREIGVGAAQDDALERLRERFPSEDLDLIVTATEVQSQVGGSLAKVLDEIAATLRERTRIEGDITALTAQQRYSAYVLALLPVFVAGALFVISRDYVQLLFQGMLRFAAIAAALMVIGGFLIMRKIAAIDV